ncbi:hypothetical protein [Aromatoleum petrolei]|uniref:Uncharacterized protein n=1 Tax=Aromatoleum petrolei TaxID=76116 RepID=A0ABX1MYR9_9RHOO|nr:hypothetical protein [Aromatoleum petrolei]NMF91451.1 hypothetical protein [Aromatoleum petrolei]QTQ34625.1 Uncharacterized protein ToN1_04530 [Aromatoleum petrolei]
MREAHLFFSPAYSARAIEVAVAHLVDDLKPAKMRARRVATLEIRVPHEPDTEIDWDTLRALVVEQTASKHWL